MAYGFAVCSRFHVSKEEFCMATKIEAIVKYGPRIAPGRPVSTSQLIDLMVRNTGQSKGECKQAFTNGLEALTFYL